MTISLSKLVRGCLGDAERQEYAQTVYDLLRCAEISEDLYYDNENTVLVDDVWILVAASGDVVITFEDPDPVIDTVVTLTGPCTPQTVVTVVRGLLKEIHAGSVPQWDLTVLPDWEHDSPPCHGEPMWEDTPHITVNRDGSVQVERVYRCAQCHGCDHVEILDRDQVNLLATQAGIPVLAAPVQDTTCRTCTGALCWIDGNTGGWWAHHQHPADNHNPDPIPARTAGGQQ
jgi:hypothetical protein